MRLLNSSRRGYIKLYDRLQWRGLKIDKDTSEAIDQATKTCPCEQVKIEWVEKLAA